jgi:hypothetical protein
VITLPWVEDLKYDTAESVKVAGGAFRLRSSRPVTVYQYNPLEYVMSFEGQQEFSYSNDASLLLPVNAWTGDYFVAARNTFGVDGLSAGTPGFYTVVASADGTTVSLKPSSSGSYVLAGAGVAADGTGKVMLDRGDVLKVLSDEFGEDPSPSDLTGTRVTADKPIQVLGGHGCTFVPFDVQACDHLEESMFPYETLARRYVVAAPRISLGGDKPNARFVRVIATEDATMLSYDPPQADAPAVIAKAGEYVEIGPTAVDFAVEANARILVAEYMLGQDAGSGVGDPAMTVAVPTEQYRTTYLFHAPTNYAANYLNIIAPDSAMVLLDGEPVAGFAPVGQSGYAAAAVLLANINGGNHAVTADQPFGISVYGYGDYTSYWYPGGLDLTALPQ